jgi:hypothetical protein
MAEYLPTLACRFPLLHLFAFCCSDFLPQQLQFKKLLGQFLTGWGQTGVGY